jgi:hypothetical protein
MSVEDRTETVAVAVAVMFFVIFIAFIGYICWAEMTADTIIVRNDGQSYACQTSRISPAPHNCKLVKEKQS